MLKHHPASALDTLLHILNDIWCSGNFPPGWRTSTVIPVLRQGKEDTDPCSYRPIALASCICKIMDRMINDRLVWYVEKNKLLSSVQCGFRKRRSTTDHVETFCSGSICTTATRRCCILSSWKSLWHYTKVWKYERFTRFGFACKVSRVGEIKSVKGLRWIWKVMMQIWLHYIVLWN